MQKKISTMQNYFNSKTCNSGAKAVLPPTRVWFRDRLTNMEEQQQRRNPIRQEDRTLKGKTSMTPKYLFKEHMALSHKRNSDMKSLLVGLGVHSRQIQILAHMPQNNREAFQAQDGNLHDYWLVESFNIWFQSWSHFSTYQFVILGLYCWWGRSSPIHGVL